MNATIPIEFERDVRLFSRQWDVSGEIIAFPAEELIVQYIGSNISNEVTDRRGFDPCYPLLTIHCS